MLLLVFTQNLHLLLECVVVVNHLPELLLDSVVAVGVLAPVLLFLEGEELVFGLKLGYVVLVHLDLLSRRLAILEELLVVVGALVRVSDVLGKMNFKLVVQMLDFLYQIVLDRLQILVVLVFGFFALRVMYVLHFFELGGLLFLDALDHFAQFPRLLQMVALDVGPLPIVLVLDDFDVSVKFFLEAAESRVLKVDQVVDVDKVVAEGHLVLLLGFVEVAIQHLQDGVFGIDFAVVVLLVNLDVLLQLLGLGKAQHFAVPVEDLHPVQMRHPHLFLHHGLQVVATDLLQMHFLGEIQFLNHAAQTNLHVALVSGAGRFAFHVLA